MHSEKDIGVGADSACGKDFFAATAMFCLFAEISLVAWLFSGCSAEYSFPMFATAVLCYGFCSLSHRLERPGLEKLLNAVIILLGAVCAIQYFNPSDEQIIKERFSYLKHLEFVKFLPSSVEAEYYLDNVLSSFVNISATLCVFAAALRLFGDERRRNAAMSWFAVNAVLMGIVACVQKWTKTPIIYDLHYTESDFFGSFTLSNAGGAFFNMAVGVCVYLAFASRGLRVKKIFCVVGWLGAAAFLSFATYESLSKGAILANVLFCVGFVLVCLAKLSAFLSRKTSAVCVAVAWTCVAVLMVFALPPIQQIKAESVKIAGSKSVKDSVASRLEIYSSVRALVEDRPFFGYGGGACAHVLPRAMMKRSGSPLAKPAVIARNAHSDILEYAIDYGFLGVATILSILAAWGYCFFKNKRMLGQIALFLAAVFCMVHSCIDIHLHIPATMITLALIMAAAVEKDGGGDA